MPSDENLTGDERRQADIALLKLKVADALAARNVAERSTDAASDADLSDRGTDGITGNPYQGTDPQDAPKVPAPLAGAGPVQGLTISRLARAGFSSRRRRLTRRWT